MARTMFGALAIEVMRECADIIENNPLDSDVIKEQKKIFDEWANKLIKATDVVTNSIRMADDGSDVAVGIFQNP